MQAESFLRSRDGEGVGYDAAMPRTLSKPRPVQGTRLLELRKAANLSQAELAALVGETQRNIAYWEQSDKPPRSDVLEKLADVLGVRVESLLRPDGPQIRRSGPVGKARLVFEEVSRLPRREQDKVVEFVSALVSQYKARAG